MLIAEFAQDIALMLTHLPSCSPSLQQISFWYGTGKKYVIPSLPVVVYGLALEDGRKDECNSDYNVESDCCVYIPDDLRPGENPAVE